LRERLVEGGMADLVEPFDPERYNAQATLAENLLFGVPTTRLLVGRSLAEHQEFRDALAREELEDDMIALGARIAETMTEIFRGLPSGHPLFEQFSFIGADELGEFEAILRRLGRRGRGGPTREDRTRLLGLPLAYIEPRHRLGLLNDSMRARLVAARARVRAALEPATPPVVEFYDPDQVCAAAPLRDNLLFGRVNHTAANAQAEVTAAITAVVDEMNLRTAIERVGLDHQVGPAGRMLSAPQRASVNLVRCVIKQPDIFVLDGALTPFGEARAPALLAFLLKLFEDRTLVVTLPNEREGDKFDGIIWFRDGTAIFEAKRPRSDQPEPDGAAVEERAPAPARRRVVGVAS
jgi:putative ABC transport system ATP-binding protein